MVLYTFHKTMSTCTLFIDLATEEEERDLITEFKVLQRVGFHPNVVNLIGASIHQGNAEED